MPNKKQPAKVLTPSIFHHHGVWKKLKTKSHIDNLTYQILNIFHPNYTENTSAFFCRGLGLSSPSTTNISLCSLPSAPPPVDFHLGWWTSARLEVANPQRQPRSFLWPMGWTERNTDSCWSKRNLHVIFGPVDLSKNVRRCGGRQTQNSWRSAIGENGEDSHDSIGSERKHRNLQLQHSC